MAHSSCKLLLLKIILEDPKVKWDGPIKLQYDDKYTINKAHNSVQHDQTKHVEVYNYFILIEKLDSGLLCLSYISMRGQLANISYIGILDKLGMDNVYSLV